MNIRKNRTFSQKDSTNIRCDTPLTTLGEDNRALHLFTFLIWPRRVFIHNLSQLLQGISFRPSVAPRNFFSPFPASVSVGKRLHEHLPLSFSLLSQAAKAPRDAEYEISNPLLAREYASYYQFLYRKIICEQKRELLYFHGL